jgi:hypothetical protein
MIHDVVSTPGAESLEALQRFARRCLPAATIALLAREGVWHDESALAAALECHGERQGLTIDEELCSHSPAQLRRVTAQVFPTDAAKRDAATRHLLERRRLALAARAQKLPCGCAPALPRRAPRARAPRTRHVARNPVPRPQVDEDPPPRPPARRTEDPWRPPPWYEEADVLQPDLEDIDWRDVK